MVRIVDFTPEYAADFERLNTEWLERYFHVEPIDARVLADPEGEIVDRGGVVLFALTAQGVLGTCALKAHGDGVYELTKMAVTATARGGGLGRALLEAAVDRYRSLGGSRLFLDTHDSLGPAIALYESGGFRHAPRPGGPSPYERSNVYMEYVAE